MSFPITWVCFWGIHMSISFTRNKLSFFFLRGLISSFFTVFKIKWRFFCCLFCFVYFEILKIHVSAQPNEKPLCFSIIINFQHIFLLEQTTKHLPRKIKNKLVEAKTYRQCFIVKNFGLKSFNSHFTVK